MRHLMIVASTFLCISTTALAGPAPGYWNGRIPTETEPATKISLLSHPYFVYMDEVRRYFYPRDFVQMPSWNRSSAPIQWSVENPWVYYAMYGCKFTTPATLVNALPTSDYSQNYVHFTGTDCVEKNKDGSTSEFNITYIVPSLNYDAKTPPKDTTIYSCRESATNTRLYASTITYEYFRYQRRNYFIGKRANMRYSSTDKTASWDICTNRDAKDVTKDIVRAMYRDVSPTRTEPTRKPSAQGTNVCTWQQREICPTNGGPCAIDYEYVC